MSGLESVANPSMGLFFVASSLGAALLGGWHCAGMCGPLATLASNKKAAFLYQAGRLMMYVTLGVISALFGERLFGWIPSNQRWILTLILGGLSFWILLSVWKFDAAIKMQKWLWRRRPRQHPNLDFLYLGALNGLLPCSWLYGFLAVAAGIHQVLPAMVLMSCLWLGSLPWLLSFSWLGGQLRLLAPTQPWIRHALLVAVLLGLFAQHLHS